MESKKLFDILAILRNLLHGKMVSSTMKPYTESQKQQVIDKEEKKNQPCP
jgi:hypothetical protein